MSFFFLVPVLLSFLLLAAHFLRAQGYVLVALSLLAPLLLLIRRRWTPWVIQLLLLLAALEWLATLVIAINQRQQAGREWLRYAIIVGSVMLFTAASGLVFALPRLRKRYA